MASSPSVPELVSRWQELRRQGRSVSPEDLCANCPERLEELKRLLHALGAMEAFLGRGAGEDTPTRPPAHGSGHGESETLLPSPA